MNQLDQWATLTARNAADLFGRLTKGADPMIDERRRGRPSWPR